MHRNQITGKMTSRRLELAEDILNEIKHQLNDFKAVRKYEVGEFIIVFYTRHERSTFLEINSGVHKDTVLAMKIRTTVLKEYRETIRKLIEEFRKL